MDKLVIIDGHAILHRAFHALPPLTTKTGEPINAVYGLVSMLLRVIQDLKPTHLIVCMDEKEKTFRQKEFKAYQAHRPKTADELSSQFAKAKDTVRAFKIPLFSKPGFEADDVIGTLTKQAKGKAEVVIVTGDRDILQLVNSTTFVYMPLLGLSQGKLYKIEEVVERMGLVPSLIPDYKALVGDSSDNYKGVPGIGPKTAITLLGKYQSVDDIYKHLEEIPPKVSEKLIKGKKDALMSHHLATIVCDVKGIKLDLEKADDWDVDNQEVLALFSEYGFKTLTERVKKVGQEQDQAKQMTLI
jgi:DNA polymerase I